MNRISKGLLLILSFLSLGHALDLTQKTSDAFNEGLQRLIQEVESTHPEITSSHSHDAGQTNGSIFPHFPCERLPPSPTKPTSVHRLRPGDIDVLAALGDSYTSAKAAGSQGLNSLLHDYRGLSWSAGGDGTFSTLHSLPNILKEYNPDVYGFSNSVGGYMSHQAGFNVAKSGATSIDLAFQAALLIQKLRNDPLVDVQNDWKLITILIGGNDICRSCHSMYNPKIYYRHLKTALDMLKSSLPRAFVNLVEIMPVELARHLPRGLVCERLQDYYCQCAVFPKSEADYNKIIEERKEFQRTTENLISSGIYDTSDDFTVVLQPFYRNASLPKKPGTEDIDYSFFAVDCFHYSAKGQSSAGLGLWNNMLQPLQHKTTKWIPAEEILCPSETHPFLTTRKNSPLLGDGSALVSHNSRQDEGLDREKTPLENSQEIKANIAVGPDNSGLPDEKSEAGIVKEDKPSEKENTTLYSSEPDTSLHLGLINKYPYDLTQKTSDAFNEGLQRLIQEVESTHPEITSDHSHNAGQTNGSIFPHFPCERLPPSPTKPTSVHRLRPGDIDVVAALGDSYTSAKAAGSQGLNSLLHDYRGLSWSAGGDGTFSTLHSLPNILKEYNPDVYGFSNSVGGYMSHQAGFNVAKSGATSIDLAFQAALLIQKLRNDPLVDVQNDWKLITILIGGNDICRSCHSMYNPKIYYRHLKTALDMLKSSLPRAFVNLVEIMPVELARHLPRGLVCERLQDYYCQCAVFPKSEADYNKIIEERKEFQRTTENLISSGIYDTSDDFTVVLQPFYRNASLPKKPGTEDIDYSFFAVDCFHYSAKGQSGVGLGLWNNMLQPLQHKTTKWIPAEEILCPSETHPFLTTRKNSPLLSDGSALVSHNSRQDEGLDREKTPLENSQKIKANIAVGPDSNGWPEEKSEAGIVKKDKPSERETENLREGLTIVVIGTIAIILVLILAGVIYYGIGVIRQMGLIPYAGRGPYQEI